MYNEKCNNLTLHHQEGNDRVSHFGGYVAGGAIMHRQFRSESMSHSKIIVSVYMNQRERSRNALQFVTEKKLWLLFQGSSIR